MPPTLLCLLALLAMPLAPAQAQPAPTAPATPTTQAATPTPPAAAITPEQARQALAVLNDPVKRAEITATLEAIARAQPTPASGSAAPPPVAPNAVSPNTLAPNTLAPGAVAPGPGASATVPTTTPAPPHLIATLGLPLAPDSLGAAVLVGAANFMTDVGNRVTDTVHAAHGLPALWLWLDTMATDPIARMLLIDLAWRLAIALAGGFAAAWWIARVLRRPLRLMGRRLIRLPPVAPVAMAPDDASAEAEDTAQARAERGEVEPPLPRHFNLTLLLRRAPLGLAWTGLALLRVLGFVIVGHVIVGTQLGGSTLVRLVLLAVIDSTALCAAALRLAHALLAPGHRRRRLLPMSDHAAAYAIRWIRRLLVVGIFGYAIAEVGLLLGLSREAHLALLKTIVLVLHICIATIVVQKRRMVRGWIRAPADAQGPLARTRNAIAAIWHWVALFYLVALWLVWAVALPTGYARLSHGLLVVLAVVVLARVAKGLCNSALERMLEAGTDLAARYPGLDGRLSFYQPFLRLLVQAVVSLVAVVLVLQLLGFGAVSWLFGTPLGQRIIGSLIMLAITLLLAFGVWEVVNGALERHLARLTRQAQIARIARLRTLLPILRTALLVAVLTVTVLMVLSEIGVNTAPLLASAGIIGVAIGFGSQKLVQDVITGLFLLLENTMQVGDVVNVGGLTGTIEALSVRAIRLRAEDGSVHVIPFSSVTTVTNMTRDYGRAVIQVGVAYKEDVDQVIEVLRGILTEMRADTQWREVILGDLEVYGLDQLSSVAAIIKGRVMCTPFGRWSVGREFNRRVKLRFAELGIEMTPGSEPPERRLILDQPVLIQHLPPSVPAPELGQAETPRSSIVPS